MKPEIRTVLENIDFVTRFKALSARFRKREPAGGPEGMLEKDDLEKVREVFAKLGHETLYDERECFFRTGVVDRSPKGKIWFNIILDCGIAEFTWVAYHMGEVRLGSPWTVYPRLLIDPDERIKNPVYRNYDELEELLAEAFLMYKDFKSELLRLYADWRHR